MATNPFSAQFVSTIAKILSPVMQDIVVALVTLLLGLIIARLLGKLVEQLIIFAKLNKVFKKATGVRVAFSEVAGSIVIYLFYFITIVITLNLLKATSIVIYAFSGIILFVVILALLLGIKDFIPNMFAGVYISHKGLLRVGDFVKFKDIEGRITEIGLVGTKIVTDQKDLFYIPNSILAKSEIIKINRKKPFSRTD
ncbi:MAG: mechanosensitive ion channel [Nanoarchaeota archaeon]|nr:mechanosensitive ion channel [Nanoarchaeota archaeon]